MQPMCSVPNCIDDQARSLYSALFKRLPSKQAGILRELFAFGPMRGLFTFLIE